MPRDKTQSHIKIMRAAKEVFLEKGYENTSIRDIASRAGMTSAGLYRHCKDKEDLFCQIVRPAVDATNLWLKNHMDRSYKLVVDKSLQQANKSSEIDFIKDVAIPYRDEFILLLEKSAGTRYENYIHKLVEQHENLMWEGLRYLHDHGYPVKEMDHAEVHILISAYVTALFEPIVHEWTEDNIKHYLCTVEEFFMPGWKSVMGFIV